jgi:hypothetical protein
VTQQDTERMPANFRDWVEILARIRFGKVTIAGKTYRGAIVKAIAGRLACYADHDGTRVRPGIVRLAIDEEVTYRTARDVVAYLRQIGLLHLVRAGGRLRADEFRLSLPVDLLERDDLEVWSPTRQRREIELAQSAHRGGRKPPGGGGVHAPTDSAIPDGVHAPEDSLIEDKPTSVHAPEDSAIDPEPPPIAESVGTAKNAIAESVGTLLLSPEGHPTDQDRYTTTTDHYREDVSATVTTPGAPRPATNPQPSPRPQRCEHGLEAGRRHDGRPACPICRALNRTAAPADERLAPVIQLHREVS